MIAAKNFEIGMHSDVHQLISVKPSMTAITMLYVLMLVWMSLTSVKGHRGLWKKKKLVPNILQSVESILLTIDMLLWFNGSVNL